MGEKLALAVAPLLIGLAAQYFGVTLPTAKQGEIDKEANWTCRDQLAEVRQERDGWIARYLMEVEKP